MKSTSNLIPSTSGGQPTRKTSRPRKPDSLSERQIQQTCTDWLALDGWRCIRTDMPHLRGLGVSEPGMPDNLYIRYGWLRNNCFNDTMGLNHVAEVLWIEYKRRSGKTAQHQKDWHATERARGAFVLSVGIDCEPSIEAICSWYAESGLQRRKVSIPR